MAIDGKTQSRVPGRRAASADWLAAHIGTIGKVLLIAFLLLFPVIYRSVSSSNFAVNVMSQAGLYAILTMAVGLVLGQAGQLSFGHSAFYGIGAYTCGLLILKFHVNTFAAWVAGAAAAGVVALIVGRPVLKLKYFYLALATIGLGQIFVAVVFEWRGGGGANGFSPVQPLNLFGFDFNTQIRKYYLIWVVAILILLFLSRLLKYRVGRALRGLSISEIASSTLGVRNATWKLLAFTSGAVFCGIAGGLFAFLYGAVSPENFIFSASVLPIVMMLVGGHRSIYGSVLGALIMTWVINGFSNTVLQYNGMVYSIIMLLLLLFLPAGLLGLRPKLARRLWASIKGESLHEVPDEQVSPGTSVAAVVSAFEAADPETVIVEGATGRGMPTQKSPVPQMAAVAVTGPSNARQSGGLPQDDTARQKSEVRGASLLRVQNLSVHFGGLKAVDEVSLEVREGSISALIGPNGAGKTTLFNAISRLQEMTDGRVWFADTELTKLGPAEAARLGMARTFQNLRIFVNMSVLENVLVGCHRHEHSGFWAGGLGLPSQRREEKRSRQRAMDALELVGLNEQANLPASSLPYGQQRLVEIARALASEPRLLLLDEPAAGMNSSERDHLISRIQIIRDAGVTVLLVEHDVNLVMGISDEVYCLDYGKLIACGAPEVIRKDDKVIAAYLGVERGEVDLCATRHLVDGESCPALEDLLVIDGLVTSYGSIEALHGVSLTVHKGVVVAVLGANGAGKSTLLRTISGITRPNRGEVHFQGVDITKMTPDKILTMGVCQVPEGRQLFSTLSV